MNEEKKKPTVRIAVAEPEISAMIAALCPELTVTDRRSADVLVTDGSTDTARAEQGRWLIKLEREGESEIDRQNRRARFVRPIDVLEFSRLMAEIAYEANLPTASPIIGDAHFVSVLVTDPITRTASYRDSSIVLTNREFALLRALDLKRGTAVCRDELNRAVWSADGETAKSNVCDVYISYLRKKMRAAFKRDMIVTVSGVGYMLSCD